MRFSVFVVPDFPTRRGHKTNKEAFYILFTNFKNSNNAIAAYLQKFKIFEIN